MINNHEESRVVGFADSGVLGNEWSRRNAGIIGEDGNIYQIGFEGMDIYEALHQVLGMIRDDTGFSIEDGYRLAAMVRG
tara:strand:+ start:1059 stop:1295 length:237 start_codon:yes stop_codon:yes gene_type:complete